MNQKNRKVLVVILDLKQQRSNLCDYADANILVKGTITITGAGDDDAAKQADERGRGVIFKKSCSIY